MTSRNSDQLYYAVDRMVVRGGRVFGFGWILHREFSIRSLNLELRLADGKSITLPVAYNKLRQDVYRAHPEAPCSRRSGFFVYGGWTDSAAISDASIVGSLQNDGAFCVGVPITVLSDTGAVSRFNFLLSGVLIRRAWALLLNGDFKILRDKIKRYWLQACARNEDISATIRRLLSQKSCDLFILVVDHDLGGGANSYRARFLEDNLARGHGILLLTYNLLSLQYVVDVCVPDIKRRFAILGLDKIVELAQEGLLTEVFYNNAVSFEEPEKIPDLLAELRQTYGLPLTLAVHDYFMICPSFVLLNSDGDYCEIPDIEQCASCLPHLDHGFVSLYAHKSIELWRKKWSSCIKVADRVLCFSNSSRHLIQKAYPAIDFEQIEVVPHAANFRPVRTPRLRFTDSLNIGVIGEIGLYKGSQVVQDLAREISRRNQDISISVIGTIEAECDEKVVTETGPYEHSQLVDLIEDKAPNVFFFPSIWPETYSYVVDELMSLDVPIVCFDLGAPAERVRNYARGKVVPLTEARTLLRSICEFYEDLSRSRGNGK